VGQSEVGAVGPAELAGGGVIGDGVDDGVAVAALDGLPEQATARHPVRVAAASSRTARIAVTVIKVEFLTHDLNEARGDHFTGYWGMWAYWLACSWYSCA
jgi:hypothetical protein